MDLIVLLIRDFYKMRCTVNSSDENELRNRFEGIRNKFENAQSKLEMKRNEYNRLQKVFWEHKKTCDELTEGMPMPDDPQYLNKKVVLNPTQRKKSVEFKKHYRSMRHCLQKMRRLQIQINNLGDNSISHAKSNISSLKEEASQHMIDIINNEALKIAQEKIKNNTNRV